jgi:hypothetical protein
MHLARTEFHSHRQHSNKHLFDNIGDLLVKRHDILRKELMMHSTNALTSLLKTTLLLSEFIAALHACRVIGNQPTCVGKA